MSSLGQIKRHSGNNVDVSDWLSLISGPIRNRFSSSACDGVQLQIAAKALWRTLGVIGSLQHRRGTRFRWLLKVCFGISCLSGFTWSRRTAFRPYS